MTSEFESTQPLDKIKYNQEVLAARDILLEFLILNEKTASVWISAMTQLIAERFYDSQIPYDQYERIMIEGIKYHRYFWVNED